MTDHSTIRTDMFCKAIHRLGMFRVVFFLMVEPLFDELFGALRTAGFGTWTNSGLA